MATDRGPGEASEAWPLPVPVSPLSRTGRGKSRRSCARLMTVRRGKRTRAAARMNPGSGPIKLHQSPSAARASLGQRPVPSEPGLAWTGPRPGRGKPGPGYRGGELGCGAGERALKPEPGRRGRQGRGLLSASEAPERRVTLRRCLIDSARLLKTGLRHGQGNWKSKVRVVAISPFKFQR